jgi:hypothetical protein
MQLIFTSVSETFFFVVFVTAIGVLLYTFGRLILNDLREGRNNGSLDMTAKKVDHYFTDKGYLVCNITPVKNSNTWLAFLVKNGEFLTATVYTDGERIKGHRTILE